jgi:hypothetical protein
MTNVNNNDLPTNEKEQGGASFEGAESPPQSPTRKELFEPEFPRTKIRRARTDDL